MEKRETDIRFHHALRVIDELCTGCTHCMSACPTHAIRVTDGKARIREERCIDCGLCYKSCPVSAIIVEQDDFAEIFRYPVRVALIPGVLFGQFESPVPVEAIYQAMRNIGFTHLFEVENMTPTISEGYDQYLEQNNDIKPAISPYCPAVIRLIQVKFPSLVDNIIRVKPPTDVAAVYLRKELEKEGYDPQSIGMFYITPCASKIASVKSPVGESSSPINGVINMDYLYNRIVKALQEIDIEKMVPGNDKQPAPESILWSLTRGESNTRGGRSLAIDGIRNVNDFLEKLEESERCNIDFLELRACDESCAGGILICQNRFLTVERLNHRARMQAQDKRADNSAIPFNKELFTLGKIRPRSMVKLDENISEAIKKMDKVEQLLRVLPGIDCGACGAPSCRVLAEDVVQGNGSPMQCIFLQEWEIRNGRLTAAEADKINASVWGSDRNNRSQKK